jgi:predicted transglutaminase-like cysteine proteinase
LKRTRLAFVLGLLASCVCAISAAVEDDILPDSRTLELVGKRYGEQAVERVRRWRPLVERDLPVGNEQSKLERSNRFFNQVPGVDDMTNWGQRDYWATPVEVLASNGADCEDYALAKYFTLKAAGVPAERLRITYVRAYLPREKRMEAHMVLAYYPLPDSEPLILDNLDPRIRPAAERSDLIPTMGFNADGLWSARQRGQSGKIGDASSIQHWNNLLARMRQEH